MSTPGMTVGDLIVSFLEKLPVKTAFGVVSIHNMPILDAIHRRGNMRFVPARGEAGALNMADACARTSGGLGVAVTSTGTAAGNARGAMVEALTAGTPLLHLTGQIDSPYLDRDLGFLHEAPDQLAMLTAVGKGAFRIASPAEALKILRLATQTALSAPTGPVSIEIPIDLQQAEVHEKDLAFPAIELPVPDQKSLDALAEKLRKAKRPLLWLGGGARHAGDAAKKLMDLGFGVVTSVQGRGIVAEDHPMTLGAFNVSPAVEALYATCDSLVVAGSRLRSNETLGYRLKLPRPLFRIDAADRRSHPYAADLFIEGDACLALLGLANRLLDFKTDPSFSVDLKAARQAAEKEARAALGPYDALVDALQSVAGRDFTWVRDVTISNSTWGNRLLKIFGPRDGVHALGGGIGQGIPMAIGAALGSNAKAGSDKKTLCLVGDGGLQLSLGELATLVQEKADVLVVLMNDRGYGVIRNIWDAQYGGRRAYSDLHTPDFAILAQSLELPFQRVRERAKLDSAIREGFSRKGPALIEVDMNAIGPFAATFAGPPVRKVQA